MARSSVQPDRLRTRPDSEAGFLSAHRPDLRRERSADTVQHHRSDGGCIHQDEVLEALLKVDCGADPAPHQQSPAASTATGR